MSDPCWGPPLCPGMKVWVYSGVGTSQPVVVPRSIILNVWEQYSFFSADFTLPFLQILFLNYLIRNLPASAQAVHQRTWGTGCPVLFMAETKQFEIYQTVHTASVHTASDHPSPGHMQRQVGRSGRQ